MGKETKVCKHCQSEIPGKAKVCPNCRKKQGGILKWIIIAVVVIGIIGAAAGGGGDSDSQTAGNADSSSKKESAQKESEPKEIEYTQVTVDDMMAALDENAVNASDTYKGKYLEVTGELSTIDSSGNYISLLPNDDFAIIGVQCYIKNDEQLSAVKELKTDDMVTVRGKCTEVGEVLGYTLDIDSIVK